MAGSLSCFILTLISIILYGIIYKFLSKKKNHCFIVFNSYKLLLIMMGSLLIMKILIIYSDKEHINNMNYPKVFIFIFNLSSSAFFLSFTLRLIKIIQSILLCNSLIKSNRKKASTFYSQRYSLMDNFYVKLFYFLSIITFIISFIKFYNNWENYSFIPFLNEIPGQITPETISLLKYNVWIIFFKSLIIITLLYHILTLSNIKKNVKIILSLQNVIYLLYFQLIFFSNIFTKYKTTLPHIVYYFFEIIQLFLVIIYSLFINKNDNMLITTIFNPKLVSDFYLFVSDEICYYSFSNYLNNNDVDKFLLNLYIEIMKFKFKYSLEAEYNNVVYEAKKIYNKYFGESSKENKYLSQEILNNVRKSCEMIDKGQCNYEMFDSLLVDVFEILKGKFTNFQSTEEYRTLVKNLNMNSYIQYKVFNLPSINAKPLNFI